MSPFPYLPFGKKGCIRSLETSRRCLFSALSTHMPKASGYRTPPHGVRFMFAKQGRSSSLITKPPPPLSPFHGKSSPGSVHTFISWPNGERRCCSGARRARRLGFRGERCRRNARSNGRTSRGGDCWEQHQHNVPFQVEIKKLPSRLVWYSCVVYFVGICLGKRPGVQVFVRGPFPPLSPICVLWKYCRTTEIV